MVHFKVPEKSDCDNRDCIMESQVVNGNSFGWLIFEGQLFISLRADSRRYWFCIGGGGDERDVSQIRYAVVLLSFSVNW